MFDLESTNRAPFVDPDVEVGPTETPGATCPYCDRPFDGPRARDLHLGERHGDLISEPEWTAYEGALEAEHDELWYYHLKVVAALSVIYAVLVLVYMVAIQSGFL